MNKTRRLVISAALSALLIVMAFTPLGYLKIGIFSITFLSIPVAIGAVLLGEWYGLFLGAVFGLTSFLQCFGMDAFGTALFNISPLGMTVTTLLTRMATGYLTGLLYRFISKKKKLAAIIICTVAAGALNTLLFTGSLIMFFRNAAIESMNIDFGNMTAWEIALFIVALNPIVEIPVCAFIGTAVSKALLSVMSRLEKGRRL